MSKTSRHDELTECFDERMVTPKVNMFLGSRRAEADIQHGFVGQMRAKQSWKIAGVQTPIQLRAVNLSAEQFSESTGDEAFNGRNIADGSVGFA